MMLVNVLDPSATLHNVFTINSLLSRMTLDGQPNLTGLLLCRLIQVHSDEVGQERSKVTRPSKRSQWFCQPNDPQQLCFSVESAYTPLRWSSCRFTLNWYVAIFCLLTIVVDKSSLISVLWEVWTICIMVCVHPPLTKYYVYPTENYVYPREKDK